MPRHRQQKFAQLVLGLDSEGRNRTFTVCELADIERGAVLVVMLGGGTKATQQTDIAAAYALARTLED